MAFHISHGDEFRAADFSHIVDAKDVLVGDLAGENELLLESLQGVCLAHRTLANYLERHHTIEILVIRFVNAAHPALTEQRFNAVSRPKVAPGGESGGVDHHHRFGIPHRHRGTAAGTRLGELGVNRAAVRTIHRGSRQDGSSPLITMDDYAQSKETPQPQLRIRPFRPEPLRTPTESAELARLPLHCPDMLGTPIQAWVVFAVVIVAALVL